MYVHVYKWWSDCFICDQHGLCCECHLLGREVLEMSPSWECSEWDPAWQVLHLHWLHVLLIHRDFVTAEAFVPQLHCGRQPYKWGPELANYLTKLLMCSELLRARWQVPICEHFHFTEFIRMQWFQIVQLLMSFPNTLIRKGMTVIIISMYMNISVVCENYIIVKFVCVINFPGEYEPSWVNRI